MVPPAAESQPLLVGAQNVQLEKQHQDCELSPSNDLTNALPSLPRQAGLMLWSPELQGSQRGR